MKAIQFRGYSRVDAKNGQGRSELDYISRNSDATTFMMLAEEAITKGLPIPAQPPLHQSCELATLKPSAKR